MNVIQKKRNNWISVNTSTSFAPCNMQHVSSYKNKLEYTTRPEFDWNEYLWAKKSSIEIIIYWRARVFIFFGESDSIIEHLYLWKIRKNWIKIWIIGKNRPKIFNSKIYESTEEESKYFIAEKWISDMVWKLPRNCWK